jgi:tetratricopeptide (TPR) repeat protein
LHCRFDAGLWCDAVEFTGLTDHTSSEDVRIENLVRAAELYTGDLLAGHVEDWVLEDRERLRERSIEVLDRLVATLDTRHEYRRAIRYAEELLRRDGLREETYRRLMRLKTLVGDRAGALRTYHACVSVLDRELGVPPDAATTTLYQLILDRRNVTLGAPDTLARWPAAPRRRAALVGREDEWQQAVTAWRESTGGPPVLLVALGEAGIGKSRLLEELADWCARQGAATAWSRSYLVEGELAYAPIADWLRSDELRPSFAALDIATRQALTRLLPELGTGESEAGPDQAFTEAERRRMLFEAVVRAVAATERPLLLILDDLQWCDRDTLELLHYVVRRTAGTRLMIAGASRDDDIGSDHPLAALLSGLADLGRLRRICLGPLSEQQTHALAEQLTDAPIAPTIGRGLFRETEGNPLFIVETMHSAGPDREMSRFPEHVVSPRVRSVIQARLDRLSPTARDLASLAAVVGRKFDYEVLRASDLLEEDALIQALDELWRRRIIREQPDGGYDFSHDKIREFAEATTGPARRRWLHVTAASALAKVHVGDLDEVAGQIARHYDCAGATDEAIRHYQLAADAANRRWASEQVITLLRTALELLATRPPTAERDESEVAILAKLSAALVGRRGNGSAEANDVYQRAHTLCQRLGRPVDPPLLRGMALGALVRRDVDEALRLGTELLRRGETSGHNVVIVEGHYILGVTTFWRGEFVSSAGHLRSALARYRESDQQEHLTLFAQDPQAVCLSRLALTEWYLGEPDAGLATCDRALECARRLAHPWTLGYVLVFAGWLAAELGDTARLIELVRQARPVTAEQKQRAELDLMVHILGGWGAANDGNVVAGIAQIKEGLAGFDRHGRRAFETLGLTLLGRAYQVADDNEAALAIVRRALELTERSGQGYLLAELLRLNGQLLMPSDSSAATASLRRAVEVAQAQHARSLEARAATALGWAHSRTH